MCFADVYIIIFLYFSYFFIRTVRIILFQQSIIYNNIIYIKYITASYEYRIYIFYIYKILCTFVRILFFLYPLLRLIIFITKYIKKLIKKNEQNVVSYTLYFNFFSSYLPCNPHLQVHTACMQVQITKSN